MNPGSGRRHPGDRGRGSGIDRLLPGVGRLVRWIDALITGIGQGAAYMIFLIMGIIALDVVMHSVFNAPLDWAQDLCRWALVFYVFLGGAWALKAGAFVRVDILFSRLTKRGQALIDLLVSTALMALFLTVMIGEGLAFGLQSFQLGETTATATWNGPVWPAKLVMPVGSTLLALAWLSHIIKTLAHLIERPPGGSRDAPDSGT